MKKGVIYIFWGLGLKAELGGLIWGMIKSGAWPELADEVLLTGAGALPEKRADPKAVISRGAETRQWAWPEGLMEQDLVAGVGCSRRLNGQYGSARWSSPGLFWQVFLAYS